MRRKKIVRFGEAAGFLVSFASGVFIQLNQEWLGEHPHTVKGLYAAAIVLAILFISQTEWMKRLLDESPKSEPAENSAPVNSSAIANGNVQKLEQHFHGLQASLLPQESAPPSRPSPEWPKFHWHFRYARVTGRNGIWRESQSKIGYQALLLEISAMAPKRGTTVRNCTLYGAIRLSAADLQRSLFLNRLCWIGEPANEMDFEIGKTATLFVLGFEGNIDEDKFKPKWVTFQNPVNRLPDHPFRGEDWLDGSDFGKKIALPVEGSPVFTVYLVDSYSGYMVDEKTLRLEVRGETDWGVKEIEQEA
jgi:hypothetical protein